MVNRVGFANFNRPTYDCLASEYESRANAWSKPTLERVKYFSQFISGTDVLDVGCGIGQDIQHFINLGYKTFGIDVSPQMVGYAQKRNLDAKIIEGNFLTLDLNRQFNAISAHSFIHLFPKDIAIQIIKKIKNSLTSGGVAFFVVGEADRPKEGWEQKSGYRASPPRYKKYWTRKELQHCLVDICGFEYLHSIPQTTAEGKKLIGFVVRKSKL